MSAGGAGSMVRGELGLTDGFWDQETGKPGGAVYPQPPED